MFLLIFLSINFELLQHNILKCLLRVTPDLPERFAYVQVGETVDVGFRSAHSSFFPIHIPLVAHTHIMMWSQSHKDAHVTYEWIEAKLLAHVSLFIQTYQ